MGRRGRGEREERVERRRGGEGEKSRGREEDRSSYNDNKLKLRAWGGEV